MSRNASTDELYFVTLTVVDWIDVFTGRYYNDFIIENLAFCQQKKNLNIYAYVIMTNHIHMVANVTDGSLSDVLGHFKTYTSKRLFEMIANNAQESRRDWMIKAFEHAGKYNPVNEKHQFWQNGNYPVLLYSLPVIEQKIDYIHENPVWAGFVGSAQAPSKSPPVGETLRITPWSSVDNWSGGRAMSNAIQIIKQAKQFYLPRLWTYTL